MYQSWYIIKQCSLDKSAMELDDLLLGEPAIEAAIDYNPLTVAPKTLLVDVMAVMIDTPTAIKTSLRSF